MPKRRIVSYRRDESTQEIHPIRLDNSVTFNSIGGLEEHKKCMREMVIFPLIYQDFFKRYNTKTPKGVLFHGPPGTGKTLLARALANECNLIRGRKVAFFMRKGADIMTKWFGESEKQLRMLFQEATKMRPSIIFFDELDALAPIRSECQVEAYTSLVATLLVEMDGLYERGDVIVIGATNRPDYVDPALRRPGRFDRELYFPPPNLLARRDILRINTCHWLPRPSEETLEEVAQLTHGFLGSDLNALCSEAVLRALRRVYPQMYEGDYHCLPSIDTSKVEVTKEDILEAKKSLLPAGSRYSPVVARNLPPHLEPLLEAQVEAATAMLKQVYPGADPGQGDVSTPCVFLIYGGCAEVHLAPALLNQLQHCSVHELSISTLHSPQKSSQEHTILEIFANCRRGDRNPVIFIPNVGEVWEMMACGPGQLLFLQQWRNRAAGDKALLLATYQGLYYDINEDLRELFPSYKNCIYRVRKPEHSEMFNFFAPILEKISAATLPVQEESNQASEKDQSGTSEGTASSSVVSPPANENYSRKRRHPDAQGGPDSKRTKYSRELSISEDVTSSKTVDFVKIFNSNSEYLCRIGLEALTDLHAQLSNTVNIRGPNSTQLPNEVYGIVARYLKLARKS